MVGHGDHGLEVSGESFPKGQVFGVLVFLIPVWNQKWNGSQGILIDGAPEQKEKYPSLALPVESERSLLPSPSLMRVQTPPIPDEGGKEGGVHLLKGLKNFIGLTYGIGSGGFWI